MGPREILLSVATTTYYLIKIQITLNFLYKEKSPIRKDNHCKDRAPPGGDPPLPLLTPPPLWCLVATTLQPLT